MLARGGTLAVYQKNRVTIRQLPESSRVATIPTT